MARAKASHITYYLLVWFLTLIVSTYAQSVPLVKVSGKESQVVFDARNICLSRCGLPEDDGKTRSRSFDSRQDVRKSTCYLNCIRLNKQTKQLSTERHKRSTINVMDDEEKYKCPDLKTVEQKIGDIRNLSVKFIQQRDIDGNLTWIANVTWDVYLNLSMFSADTWYGFIILWKPREMPNNPTSGFNYCRFNFKNTTYLIIKSGSGDWVYPKGLDINVLIYPSTKEDVVDGLDMITFDPKEPLEPTTLRPLKIQTSNTIAPVIVTTYFTPEGQAKLPTTKNPNIRVLASTIGSCCGLVFVGLVFYLVWKKHRKPTTHPEDPENYEFDASILYSSLDERWVTEELIPFLETENKFRCFIHFRDFEAGKVISENMADAVYKCRKNLAVVSRNFLNSNYCKEELFMALERVQSRRDYSLIVINLDGVPIDLLPKALRIRTFVNLTSLQERLTWKNRLVRQISVEERNTSSNNGGNQAVRVITEETQIVNHINDLTPAAV